MRIVGVMSALYCLNNDALAEVSEPKHQDAYLVSGRRELRKLIRRELLKKQLGPELVDVEEPQGGRS